MTVEALEKHEQFTMKCDPTDYRRQSLREYVVRHMKGKKVLDMRCITGQVVKELIKRGYDVTALDDYPGGVKRTNEAAKELGVEREVARIWRFKELKKYVNNETFDTILCMDVINHVEDDSGLIRDIRD